MHAGKLQFKEVGETVKSQLMYNLEIPADTLRREG